MEHLGASEQGTGQPREKVAARGAPGTGGWKEGRPEAQEFKDSDRVTGGTRAGSHRVGYAPQEHAHQRVSRPEHLHLLLHEMLFLGFGGEAETWTRSRCCRRYGGRRSRGGRHGLPRTRLSGSRSRELSGFPTPEAVLTCAAVT